MPVSVIMPLDANSSIFLYFDIHLDNPPGRLAPGTVLCGQVVLDVSTSTAPQDLYVVVPSELMPLGLSFSRSYLWAGELPVHLQHVGYVSARLSTDLGFFHGPMYASTHPQHTLE
jgi:hypothetical protein